MMPQEPAPDGLSQLVSQLASSAKDQQQDREPGPGDVGPSLDTRANELVTLPMSEEEVQDWWARIERSRERRTKRAEKWDILLDEYLPTVSKSGEAETVKVNQHFRNVHSKIGMLFFQRPELVLTPKDPGPMNNVLPSPLPVMPGMPVPPPVTMEDVISIKQAVLNEKLGDDEIDAEWLMDELLFDVLAWSGVGASKLGYRCFTQPIQRPVMVPDPSFVPPPIQPGMLGLNQPQAPLVPDPSGQMETIPVPIYDEWYWRRFSPKKLLLDDGLQSGRIQKDSTWIAMEFFLSKRQAMLPPNQGGLGMSEEDATAAAEDDLRHTYQEDAATAAPKLIQGVEAFCLARTYANHFHPLAVAHLVLIEGNKTKPFVWRLSPDQTFQADGTLTPDSLVGFPIRVLSIRDLADTAYPNADSAFTNSGIKQISTWRRQSILLRDAAAGKILYDKGAFDEAELDELKNGTVGTWVGVKEGLLRQGADKVMAPAAQLHATADDYRGAELLKRDNDETLGIGSTQAGTPEQTVQTATQIAAISTAVAGRNNKERNRALKFYLQGVRMIDQLLMRYAKNVDYVNIGGDEAGQKIAAWNGRLVSGKYLYEVSPDSALALDTEHDYKLLLDLYNVASGDPLFNRVYALKRLARMRRLDPGKVVMQAMIPPPGQPLPPHGGVASPVNKHLAGVSGNRPNEPGAVNQRQDTAVGAPGGVTTTAGAPAGPPKPQP